MEQNGAPTIDTFLRMLPMPNTSGGKSGPETLLDTLLPQYPSIALSADANGYTLLHACASYASPSLKKSFELLRALVQKYKVDVDVEDVEGDTPLFYAEQQESARILVQELGADWTHINGEEISAWQNAKINAEDEEGSAGESWSAVAQYLKSLGSNAIEASSANDSSATNSHQETGSSSASGHPPPLPPGVSMNLGNVSNLESWDRQLPPDPEFRARIEALAARSDFQGEQGQAGLKRLVEDALGGISRTDDSDIDSKRSRTD